MDHAGLAQDLKQLGMRLLVLETQVAAIPLMKSSMKPVDAYTDITLHDNVVISFADSRGVLEKMGLAGEILATPGHSDDSVSLLLDDGSVFTGDLTPPGFATDENAETVMASWNLLLERGAKHIYPGHGPARPLV
jgi:glyoxylase-like metal-dependent hydrolase (beta-lactamase superfamily II)